MTIRITSRQDRVCGSLNNIHRGIDSWLLKKSYPKQPRVQSLYFYYFESNNIKRNLVYDTP